MYLDYYNLHLKPFQISTDPRFLWLGEKHQEALAVLKYGIQDNKGFLLLTGDVGTGKTTLLNALASSLGDEVVVAMVPDPGLQKMDFFNFIADSFGVDKKFTTKGEFLIFLRNFLTELNRQHRQALLIIDECQHLNQRLLEEVRLLSNIERADTKLINIFFVGQSEFNDTILRPQNRAIRKRITINYNITALSEAETNEYIRYRLDVAGAADTIFTENAIREVYRFSDGYPRLINIICDQSLLTGFVRERRHVDEQIVAECANELKIEGTLPISKSDATPDATMGSDEAPTFVDRLSATWHNYVRFKKPWVITVAVILLIWAGLMATYIFSNRTSDATNGAVVDPQALESRSSTAAAPPQEMSAAPPGKDDTGAPPSSAAETPTISDGPAQSVSDEASELEKSVTDELLDVKRMLAALVAKVREDEEQRLTLDDIQAKHGRYPEVLFDVNSDKLNAAAYDVLGDVSRYCLQNPESILVLRGYTDKSGMRAYNIKLSDFRANVVKSYLIGKGIKDEAITTIAMGPDEEGPGGTTVSHDGPRRKVVIEIIAPTE